jgi:hypothetical protein
MIQPMTLMSPAVDPTNLPPRRLPGRDDMDPSRFKKFAGPFANAAYEPAVFFAIIA